MAPPVDSIFEPLSGLLQRGASKRVGRASMGGARVFLHHGVFLRGLVVPKAQKTYEIRRFDWCATHGQEKLGRGDRGAEGWRW